ncbi:MAG: SGNH/GDSL hydrolase family protein [Alphaproteobacteria bacterium]|nr:SGNH/GDSL hydrolase family protein [Alphaproteobacteria bacterium]
MTQATPTVPNGSGAAYRTDANAARSALLNHHKGATATTYAEAGILWLDDSATPWLMKMYDGTDWITLGAVNATTNVFTPDLDTDGMLADNSDVKIVSQKAVKTYANNAASRLRRAKPKVACIGSSYTQNNIVQSSGTILYKESRSWTDWWNILTGNSLNMDVYLDATDPLSRGFSGANFGVSGEDSTEILARIPDVIAVKPDVCLVQSGSNNVGSPATVIADVKASMLLLYNAGILGVYMGINFRRSASWDAEEMQQAAYINNVIARWLADNGYGIYIDTNKYICDFDTAAGTPYAGALHTDSIHYVTWSAFQIGRLLHENISPLLALNSAEITGNAEAYNSTNNPHGNIWTNPLVSINSNVGSGAAAIGTGVTAGTGTVATSIGRAMKVERNSGTSTGVVNVESRGAGKGNWQQLVVSPVGSSTSLFLIRSNGADITHGLDAGTWVRVGCDVDVSTFGTGALNSGFQNVNLYVDLRTASDSVGRVIAMHQYSEIPLPNIAWNGRLEIQPFQIPATCTIIRARVEVKVDDTADETGTIKVGSIYIRPCSDPTLIW